MKTPLFLVLMLLYASKLFAEDLPLIDKKKFFKLEYNVDKNDKLKISNSYGDIKVVLWNKNAIQTNVTVTSSAANADKAEEILESIEIMSSKTGNEIKIRTQFENNRNYGGKRNAATKLSVDYIIYMPEWLALEINNNYGDVTLPEITAPLKLNLNYCKLNGENFNNAKINVNYCEIDAGKINDSEINSNYTNIIATNLSNISIKNNYGDVKIRSFNNSNGVFNYSDGNLGDLEGDIDLKMNYSGDLHFTKLDETLNSLNINANYSDLELPISPKLGLDFDINSVYSDFHIGKNVEVQFSQYPNAKNNGSSKKYIGKIGSKASKANMKISVTYGDLVIKSF